MHAPIQFTMLLPWLLIVACGKGGVGKTLFATILNDLLELGGRPPIIIQLDFQTRLQLTTGRAVITIDTETLRASRRDPAAGVKAFRPLVDALERAARENAIVLLDIGATLVSSFLAFAALAELDDDLRAEGFATTLFTPTLADPESLRLAASTIRSFRSVIPSARAAFVENRRDGAIDDLPPGSEGAEVYDTSLRPLLIASRCLIMPAVEGGSWRHFERHSCRPIDVVGMEIAEITALTGLNRTEAKIARSDVAAWLGVMQEQLSPLLDLGDVK